MGGATFHPGHDDLHGMTVVLLTSGSMTYVGRWDSERDGRILMHDVSVHEEGSDGRSRADFLRDTKTYGVAVTAPSAAVRRAEVSEIVKLADLQVPGA